MSRASKLRALLCVLVTATAIGVACSSRTRDVDTTATRPLGLSTAQLPSDPSMPAPDAGETQAPPIEPAIPLSPGATGQQPGEQPGQAPGEQPGTPEPTVPYPNTGGTQGTPSTPAPAPMEPGVPPSQTPTPTTPTTPTQPAPTTPTQPAPTTPTQPAPTTPTQPAPTTPRQPAPGTPAPGTPAPGTPAPTVPAPSAAPSVTPTSAFAPSAAPTNASAEPMQVRMDAGVTGIPRPVDGGVPRTDAAPPPGGTGTQRDAGATPPLGGLRDAGF